MILDMKKQKQNLNETLTKKYFKDYLDKKLENYVTKAYLDKRIRHLDKRIDAVIEYIKFELQPIKEFRKEFNDFKERVSVALDQLLAGFKKFDEEHTILSGRYSEVNEKLDNHEARISVLEDVRRP